MTSKTLSTASIRGVWLTSDRGVQITTAAQAAERDANAIASGIDSFDLMHAAGVAAAWHIMEIASQHGIQDIFIWAGAGNNGGDAYVVAAYLTTYSTFAVRLTERGEPRTPDAQHARALYLEAAAEAEPLWDVQSTTEDQPMLFVDGLLGTGQSGPLREREVEFTSRFNENRAHNWIIVALDLPTGVNATTGEVVEHAIRADYTLAFGTLKRAHVLKREQCGETRVLEIGLGEFAAKNDGAWTLVDEAFARERIPAISPTAHKGTRGRVAIVGGARGMAGAVTLAAFGALRSGAGLVHTFVADESVLPLQITVPQALAHNRHDSNVGDTLSSMDAIVVGPGFGRDNASAKLLEQLCSALVAQTNKTPLLLDADALTILSATPERLAHLAATRAVVCTPHPGEFARLIGEPAAELLDARIEQAKAFANKSRCTVLLKGTPTIVVSPDDANVYVIPRGSAVLATGGSGDLLCGIIGTLLAQGMSAPHAASCGALVHALAAEIATDNANSIRGVVLSDVLDNMLHAWKRVARSSSPDESSNAAASLLSVIPRLRVG
jgi:hydroxyethylthiazole kinase-like uncharacterized protein yjeF